MRIKKSSIKNSSKNRLTILSFNPLTCNLHTTLRSQSCSCKDLGSKSSTIRNLYLLQNRNSGSRLELLKLLTYFSLRASRELANVLSATGTYLWINRQSGKLKSSEKRCAKANQITTLSHRETCGAAWFIK